MNQLCEPSSNNNSTVSKICTDNRRLNTGNENSGRYPISFRQSPRKADSWVSTACWLFDIVYKFYLTCFYSALRAYIGPIKKRGWTQGMSIVQSDVMSFSLIYLLLVFVWQLFSQHHRCFSWHLIRSLFFSLPRVPSYPLESLVLLAFQSERGE